MSTSTRELEYSQLARLGLTSWRRHLAAVATILGFWLVLGSAAALAVSRVAGGPDLAALSGFVAVMASFVGLLAGTAVAVRAIHRRPLRTLVTPRQRVDLRRIAHAFLVFSVALTAARGVEALLDPGSFSLVFDPVRWLVALPVALALLPVQVTAEELVFRGYALQTLGLLTRRRTVLVAASAVLFAAPHLANRELALGAPVLLTYYVAFGVLLAWVTLREGRLEVALGAHAANNLSAALVVGSAGSSLGTPAIWQASDAEPLHHLVGFLVAVSLASALLLRRRPTSRDAPGTVPRRRFTRLPRRTRPR